MSDSPTFLDPTRLLAETDFVRRLARSLLRDANDVEDVVQDTWLRTAERPADLRSTRSWLGTVVRNIVRNKHASESARRRFEAHAAEPEATPSPDVIRAREELRAKVVETVLGLPDPYREVLILRFFEDLSPAAITARTGRNGNTIRTQILRGLAMVRTSLDREHGDRRTWTAALMPLAMPSRSGAAAGTSTLILLGITVKKTHLALLVVLILTATAATFALDRVDHEVESQPPGTAAEVSATGAQPDAETPSSEQRVAAVTPRTQEDQEPEADHEIRGVLRTAEGAPVAGARFWVQPDETRIPDSHLGAAAREPADPQRTDDDGAWAIPRNAEGLLWLRVDDSLAVVHRISKLRTREPAAASGVLVLTLPARAKVTFRCSDVPTGETWRADIFPTMNLNGRRYPVPAVHLDDREAADFVVLSRTKRQFAADTGSVLLLRGETFSSEATGRSFQIREGTTGRQFRAPATIRYQAGAATPTVGIEIVDARGLPVRVGGRAFLGIQHRYTVTEAEVRDGRATLGFADLDSSDTHEVCVELDDGEFFRREVAVRDAQSKHTIRFERGRGTPAHTLALTGLADTQLGAVGLVVLDLGGGRIRLGGVAAERFDADHPIQFRHRTRARETLLIGAPVRWLRAWVLYEDGTLARATHSGRSRSPAQLERGAALPPIDIGKHFSGLAARTHTTIQFEIQLPTSAGPEWFLVDLAHMRTVPGWEPTWRKFGPGARAYRVQMVNRNGSFDITPGR